MLNSNVNVKISGMNLFFDRGQISDNEKKEENEMRCDLSWNAARERKKIVH